MIGRLYPYIILSILAFPIIFLKLDSFHIRWWDESVYSVNAYEMIQNGKYFSPYFEGIPDFFNTKPPLLIWFQILFIKLIGFNELAVRLPSAIAAVISVFIVFYFVKKWHDEQTAWLASLILLCSKGFIGFHTARTGDTDSVFTLFCLLANVSFIHFIINNSGKNILLFFLFMTMAFLTKMYACLLFVPAYLIILIIQKKIKKFFLAPLSYIGIIFFLATIFLFFWLREQDAPGYIWKTIQTDAGRLTSVTDNHSENWYFYIENIVNDKFSIWFIPFIFGVIISFKKRETSSVNLFLVILSVTFIFLISVSQTKLHWYDAPVYPYLSIISAVALRESVRIINFTSIAKNIGFLALIFCYPYYQMFRQSQGNTIKNEERELEASEQFLYIKSKEKQLPDTLTAYYAYWPGSLLFYKYKFEQQKKVLLLTKKGVFKEGENVLVSNDSLYNIIKSNYLFTEKEEKIIGESSIKIISITGKIRD